MIIYWDGYFIHPLCWEPGGSKDSYPSCGKDSSVISLINSPSCSSLIFPRSWIPWIGFICIFLSSLFFRYTFHYFVFLLYDIFRGIYFPLIFLKIDNNKLLFLFLFSQNIFFLFYKYKPFLNLESLSRWIWLF